MRVCAFGRNFYRSLEVPMKRVAVLLMLGLFCPAYALAQGYMARLLNHPVPGGVAVVPLGTGTAAPQVYLGKDRVMVLHDSDGQWIAVVGIDLKTAPGQQTIRIEGGARSEQLSFQVGRKQYKTQHITRKNKSQVNPDPEQVRSEERRVGKECVRRCRYRRWTYI